MIEESWPALLEAGNLPHEDPSDLGKLRAVWSGTATDAAAMAMVTGTAAVALKAMGRATTQADAQRMADSCWRGRDKGALRGAA